MARQPRNPFHPGEILLEELLAPVGLTPAEFAGRIGWTRTRLNELIKGKRGITTDAALDLAEAVGTSPKLWMNLQTTFDLDRAAKARELASSTGWPPSPRCLRDRDRASSTSSRRAAASGFSCLRRTRLITQPVAVAIPWERHRQSAKLIRSGVRRSGSRKRGAATKMQPQHARSITALRCLAEDRRTEYRCPTL